MRSFVCAIALLALSGSAAAQQLPEDTSKHEWTGFLEDGYVPAGRLNQNALHGDGGFTLVNGFGPHVSGRYVYRTGTAAFGGINWIVSGNGCPFGVGGKKQNLHLALDVGGVFPESGDAEMRLAFSGMYVYAGGAHGDGVLTRFRLEAPRRDLRNADYELDFIGMSPLHLGAKMSASTANGIGTGVAYGLAVAHAWIMWMPLDPHGHDRFTVSRFAAGGTIGF